MTASIVSLIIPPHFWSLENASNIFGGVNESNSHTFFNAVARDNLFLQFIFCTEEPELVSIPRFVLGIDQGKDRDNFCNMRIFMVGATGTIGKATRAELVQRGHDVFCFGRDQGDVTEALSIERDGFRGKTFDAVISCMASRSGLPRDAWLIDHRAHSMVLHFAKK